jgi:phosphoglycerate dehydrogenase-like enzyme
VADPIQIRTMVIDVPLPESVIANLKSDFPRIDFVFPGDPRRAEKIGIAEAYFHWNLPAETLAEAPNLRWYQSVAAGVDSVITPELIARNIIVTNNSGVHASNIAEHVLAMMLALARRLPGLILAQSRHVWTEEDTKSRMGEIFELGDQTLLVVGYGDIGQRLAKIASGIGMTVDAVKRTVNGERDAFVREIAPIGDLKRLLANADHVAICLPLTPETRRLFDAEHFAAMKPGSFLYNIGRGPIIDQNALIAALQSGHLCGAGLDVTDPEPLSADSPLWEMANVIITAHTAGATPLYWERAGAILTANIKRVMAGETPLNLVNQRLGY